MMKMQDFQDLLDAKGPDTAAWPWLKRRAAERLLARSGNARAALARARADDAALADALRPAPLDATFRARLDAIALAHPQALPARAPETSGFLLPMLRRWWYAGAATAMASLVLGVVVGATLPADFDEPDQPNLATLVYGPSNGGLLP